MKHDDAIPQLIILEECSKRTTVELCGADDARGVRCSLLKGHAGAHESLATTGVVRWLSKAS